MTDPAVSNAVAEFDAPVEWLSRALDQLERVTGGDLSQLDRVKAERGVIAQYQSEVADIRYRDPDRTDRRSHDENIGGASALHIAIRWLAWGHRHDIDGWQSEWRPAGAGWEA